MFEGPQCEQRKEIHYVLSSHVANTLFLPTFTFVLLKLCVTVISEKNSYTSNLLDSSETMSKN